ncbi:MAG: phosphatase PAP2 family protein [Pseudolysinimonas sp.]
MTVTPGKPPPSVAASPNAPAPVKIARLWPIASATAALLLTGGLAAVIFYRQQNKPFGFELEWMDEILDHRNAFWTVPALVFNYLGGGILAIAVVPVLIIVGLLLWRRRWAAMYFAISAAASVIVVQIVKALVGRPRPPDIDMLVHPDFGSFPSGHSANAALIAVTLGIIFARAWVWAAGAVYTVGMMLSRTYLGAHWISDTVGGMLVGAGVALIVWTPFAYVLYREAHAPHPPVWKRT